MSSERGRNAQIIEEFRANEPAIYLEDAGRYVAPVVALLRSTP